MSDLDFSGVIASQERYVRHIVAKAALHPNAVLACPGYDGPCEHDGPAFAAVFDKGDDPEGEPRAVLCAVCAVKRAIYG